MKTLEDYVELFMEDVKKYDAEHQALKDKLYKELQDEILAYTTKNNLVHATFTKNKLEKIKINWLEWNSDEEILSASLIEAVANVSQLYLDRIDKIDQILYDHETEIIEYFKNKITEEAQKVDEIIEKIDKHLN
jgi:hypothetical protein